MPDTIVISSLIAEDTMNYPQKNRFQSVPIAALSLYNIQRENLVFKRSPCRIIGINPIMLINKKYSRGSRQLKKWPSYGKFRVRGGM